MLESHRQEIAKLEALYASNPGGRVFVHLAEALRKGGEHERARSILDEGLARHPGSASGFVVLGRLLVDMGDAPAAEGAFRQVLELDGGNLVALRCLGDLARDNGRRDEAIGLYRELIARNPSSDDVAATLRTLESEVVAAESPDEVAETAAEPAEAIAAVEPAATVAPDRMRPAPAEPEFGMIELSALPGDLAAFAGLATPEYGADELAEPEPRPLEDDMVSLIESSAAPLELEEFGDELHADPVEINILHAAPELSSESAIPEAAAEPSIAAAEPVFDEPSLAAAEAVFDEPSSAEQRRLSPN